MSRDQVRSRLQQAGYDPGLADQYFDSMEGIESTTLSEVDQGFLEAMRALGILPPGVDFPLDPIALDPPGLAADTLVA
ncbi:MAG TPA: hypothetical protein EYO97_02555, partial [Gemmatimonadetes bacterium]|nr:hypothetical protein [Gemmatimonadota bacterium]